MRLKYPLAAGLLVLAGCAAERPSQAPRTIPQEVPPLVSHFAEDAPDTVEVILRDRKPVERAELVPATGQAYDAGPIRRERIAVDADGQPIVGLQASGGSSEIDSLGVTLPLFGIEKPKAQIMMLSTARIRVADMAAYRAGWPRWIVRLRLGTPQTTERTVEFPAPRPPEE
jgi:hypothetical protein